MMKNTVADEFYYNGFRFYKSINGYYYQDMGTLGKLRISKSEYDYYVKLLVSVEEAQNV